MCKMGEDVMSQFKLWGHWLKTARKVAFNEFLLKFSNEVKNLSIYF